MDTTPAPPDTVTDGWGNTINAHNGDQHLDFSTYWDDVTGGRDHLLTVGVLRRILANLPDDMTVVIATDGWYDNVGSAEVPGPDPETAEWMCLTLNHGDEFDPRQL